MALLGLVAARNLADAVDRERAWDNLGLNISADFLLPNLDVDASAYLQAVMQADGLGLESAVQLAVNNFVVGCKNDGIWTAIKASCILAGARTLTGALVPLVGTAPTNNGFVGIGTDYNRKTGLVGNGSTKYLDSNRNNNADPQNSNHNAVYVSTAASNTGIYMSASASTTQAGDNNFGTTGLNLFSRSRSSVAFVGDSGSTTGFIGINRSGSTDYLFRRAGSNRTVTQASQTPFDSSVHIYAGPTGAFPSNARLAFYSIGESLDLALLDARVTDLINVDLPAAIP
jgi:hypothetical protein